MIDLVMKDFKTSKGKQNTSTYNLEEETRLERTYYERKMNVNDSSLRHTGGGKERNGEAKYSK